MTDIEREQLIRDSITLCRSNGIPVACGQFGIAFDRKTTRWIPIKNGRCCALSCVLLACQERESPLTDYRSFHLDHILATDVTWRDSFQAGWDGRKLCPIDGNSTAHEMGQRLAIELLS